MSAELLTDLNHLLLPVADLDDAAVETAGIKRYQQLYLNQGRRGEHQLHGGGSVVFWDDRYEHAFRTSHDRARHPFLKDVVAVPRVERIEWIGPILRGEVAGTECWHVRALDGKLHPLDRLYIWWPANYVIWLNTKTKDYKSFKFSSAYVATAKDIREKYLQGQRSLQWRL